MIKRLLIACTLILSSTEALKAVIPDRVPCVTELETRFFNPVFVSQGLSLYQIPQGLWDPIIQSLQQKSSDVPDRMKKRTERMNPNPIEYPLKKLPTAKILKSVLFDVFMETMRDYQVNERPTADFIFEYIFLQQMPSMVHCFGEEVKTLSPSFE